MWDDAHASQGLAFYILNDLCKLTKNFNPMFAISVEIIFLADYLLSNFVFNVFSGRKVYHLHVVRPSDLSFQVPSIAF